MEVNDEVERILSQQKVYRKQKEGSKGTLPP